MVQDRLRDGKRVAQLLSSEITGNSGTLGSLSVVDADADVEPTADGALAYAVADDATDERVAEVYVQEDRARVEFLVGVDVAAESGREQDLRVRPKATRPPRTLVFVEDGAQVKWILPVFETVLATLDEE